MGTAIKKPVEVEFITFNELSRIHYDQRSETVKMLKGVPYDLLYKGVPISMKDEKCYLIPTKEGVTVHMTPEDVLITNIDGYTFPCKKNIFLNSYDIISNTSIENFD